MFHICGKFHHYREFFLKLFEEGNVTCLQGGIRQDFMNPCAPSGDPNSRPDREIAFRPNAV